MSLSSSQKAQWFLGRVALYTTLLFFSALFILPFLWMISTSLKTSVDSMKVPPVWIPDPPQWRNFAEAVAKVNFIGATKNTLYLCLMNVIGTTLSSALVAYGFARINWRGRDKFFAFTLGTMMIPFPVMMVPIYSIYRNLDWIGTFKPLWVGSFFAGAYNIFLLRQFFMTIPRDLTEAAEIDGCSEGRMFLQMILPLAKPALLVVALFCFMGVWNDFLGPLIYLSDESKFTLALALQSFQSAHGGTAINHLMAASTLVILPIVILYFFMQRTFIEGIALTGLK